MPSSRDAPHTQAIWLWEERLDELDYYAILGVAKDDDAQAVEAAYHRFALQFHPDCHPDAESPLRNALTRIFQRGAEARRVLSDPQLRTRYRMKIREGQLRLVDDAPVATIDLDEALPKLHERCRSAGAKLEALAAARAAKQGNGVAVRRHVEAALHFDGGANPDLKACLDALDGAAHD